MPREGAPGTCACWRETRLQRSINAPARRNGFGIYGLQRHGSASRIRKATCSSAVARALGQSCVVVDPRHACKLHAREPGDLGGACRGAPWQAGGNSDSRTARMHASEGVGRRNSTDESFEQRREAVRGEEGRPLTRRIEFGRFAGPHRERRGEGKPQTFDFLGFTHISGKDRNGNFSVKASNHRETYASQAAGNQRAASYPQTRAGGANGQVARVGRAGLLQLPCGTGKHRQLVDLRVRVSYSAVADQFGAPLPGVHKAEAVRICRQLAPQPPACRNQPRRSKARGPTRWR
jgi:hypothetical protein